MKEFMRFVSVDVGDTICAHAYGVRKKEIIPALIGAAVAVGSAVYSGVKSAKKNKEAQAEMAAQNARNNAWYTRRYNEDYADTAAGQNLIRQAKDYAKENWKKAQGSAAVGGGTDAATAMAKESGNKMVGDTIANIAAQDVARKTNVDNIHHSDEQNYSNQVVNLKQQQANNIAQVGSQVSDAAMNAGVAFDGFNSGSTATNGSLTSGVSSIKAEDVTKGVGKIKAKI